MRTSFFWMSLLAFTLAACASFNSPPRFSHLQTPADALSNSANHLQVEIREFLKDEDRWIPRGRDVSFWQAALMLSASAQNLSNNMGSPKLTDQELATLVNTATRRLHELEYWAANVRINESVQRSLSEARSTMEAVRRSAKTVPLNTADSQRATPSRPRIKI